MAINQQIKNNEKLIQITRLVLRYREQIHHRNDPRNRILTEIEEILSS